MEQKEIKDQAECIKSIMLNVLNILRKDLSQNASIHQASASVQKLYSNVATVSMVQSFVCNPITISKIQNSTCGSASCSVKKIIFI